MQARLNFKPKRPGFTLIELLMVIAIIAVLVSLLMAAVFKASVKGEEVQARADISQLAQGVTTFMTKFSVKDPPPSRLFLGSLKRDYFSDPPTFSVFKSKLHQDSYEYLLRLWPRLAWTKDPNYAINWGGGPTQGQVLEGEQCLVFFLGGIPSPEGCSGFSTNPQDPSLPGGDRVRIFDDFKPGRLITVDNQPWAPGKFFAYKDAFNKAPYAYFSSYKGTDGYNRYFPLFRNSDCDLLKVWPYAITITNPMTMGGKYVNPSTFQIISAGSDGLFGTGTNSPGGPYWKPNQTIYPGGNAGQDDMSNFHDRLLGSND